MKVAIVHDYLNQYGGAERVLEAIAELFPGAPIYTSIYDKQLMAGKFKGHEIRASFMQSFPGILKRHQPYLLVYPFAFERFGFDEFDLVISSSSAFAKGIKTSPNTLHICYCHAPMRFAWATEDYARGEKLGKLSRIGLPFIMGYVKLWDVSSAARPNFFIANSNTVAGRIEKYWGRTAEVIYPPVEVNKIPYNTGEREDFYITTARLMAYKRVDVTIRAFKELDLPLKIVGTGRDLENLRKLAGPKTQLLGYVSDAELWNLYTRCRAFIQTGAEDFGIAQVEAMAAGSPVIAINKFGPSEVNIDNQTGLLFDEQTSESLVAAVKRFESIYKSFDSRQIRKHAEGFDHAVFSRRLKEYVELSYLKFKEELASPIT